MIKHLIILFLINIVFSISPYQFELNDFKNLNKYIADDDICTYTANDPDDGTDDTCTGCAAAGDYVATGSEAGNFAACEALSIYANVAVGLADNSIIDLRDGYEEHIIYVGTSNGLSIIDLSNYYTNPGEANLIEYLHYLDSENLPEGGNPSVETTVLNENYC